MNPRTGDVLLQALAQHHREDPRGIYDETLHAVIARAKAEHSLGKADIGSLVLWKRVPAQTGWAKKFMLTPDREVREATHAAFAASNNSGLSIPDSGNAAREALRVLPGMTTRVSIASAVLLALSPERMAVWDSRVRTALQAAGLYSDPRKGFYGEYLRTTLCLADAMHEADPQKGSFTPRDVDLALYAAAGSASTLSQLRASATSA